MQETPLNDNDWYYGSVNFIQSKHTTHKLINDIYLYNVSTNFIWSQYIVQYLPINKCDPFSSATLSGLHTVTSDCRTPIISGAIP